MSSADSAVKTATIFVCRLCGKVGTNATPSPIDFGGCVPPSKAHVFQKLEVVLKQ
jgi:hypothetical protein